MSPTATEREKEKRERKREREVEGEREWERERETVESKTSVAGEASNPQRPKSTIDPGAKSAVALKNSRTESATQKQNPQQLIRKIRSSLGDISPTVQKKEREREREKERERNTEKEKYKERGM